MQVALRRKDRGVAEDLRHQLDVAGSIEQVRDERVESGVGPPPGGLVEPKWRDDARFPARGASCLVTLAKETTMYLETNLIHTSDR